MKARCVLPGLHVRPRRAALSDRLPSLCPPDLSLHFYSLPLDGLCTKIAELTIFGFPMRRCLSFCCIRTSLEQHQVHANSLENKTLNRWSINSPPPSDVRWPLICRYQALPPPKEYFTSCKQNLPLLESTDMPDWFPFFLMLQPRYTYCPFGPRT